MTREKVNLYCRLQSKMLNSKSRWNFFFLVLNVSILVIMFIFYGRWKVLRENIRKRYDDFIAYKDIGGSGPYNKYLRLPYLHYRFQSTTNGFVEIGDFMMQWGIVYNERDVNFPEKFERCGGCVCTPAPGAPSGGQFDICIKEISRTGFRVYAAGCERPFYYIAYGSRYKYEEK